MIFNIHYSGIFPLTLSQNIIEIRRLRRMYPSDHFRIVKVNPTKRSRTALCWGRPIYWIHKS
jgi:hypothetical protein